MSIREGPKHELDNSTRLILLNKESSDQTRLNSYEEIIHAQGSDSYSSKFEAHSIGDSLDNGTSSGEENKGFEDIDLG